MLAARLLTALSLSSFALLSSASMTPDSDLAERALSVGDDIDAPNWQRDLHERSPEPCATGSCPCTNDDCRRPKPKPKPKKNQEKIYRGIDFERQAGNTYVRVILADSMRIGSPPIVIDTKECMDFVAAGYPLNDPEAVDAVYNRNPLQTRHLVDDPVGARNCMAYRLLNFGGGGKYNLTKYSGYPVGVRIANDTESTIGWDFQYDTNAKSGKISWVKNSKTKGASGRVVMDCKYWWSAEPNNGPRWHGKRCLMRLDVPGTNALTTSDDLCIAADKVDNGDMKPLLFAPCNRDDTSQVWHLQAVAQDYTTYRCDDASNQSCWGNSVDQNPNTVLQKSKACKPAGAGNSATPAVTPAVTPTPTPH